MSPSSGHERESKVKSVHGSIQTAEGREGGPGEIRIKGFCGARVRVAPGRSRFFGFFFFFFK